MMIEGKKIILLKKDQRLFFYLRSSFASFLIYSYLKKLNKRKHGLLIDKRKNFCLLEGHERKHIDLCAI